MLTQQHIAEGLSLAYVEAVSARAGTNLSGPRRHDYGFDGTFRQVKIYQRRRVESGYALDFQCKATVNWELVEGEIVYDLEARTWNDLVRNNGEARATRSVLLLLCLPKDEADWLQLTPSELILRECCYWAYLTGRLSENKQSVRIKIPETQRFTPEALTRLLNLVASGELA